MSTSLKLNPDAQKFINNFEKQVGQIPSDSMELLAKKSAESKKDLTVNDVAEIILVTFIDDVYESITPETLSNELMEKIGGSSNDAIKHHSDPNNPGFINSLTKLMSHHDICCPTPVIDDPENAPSAEPDFRLQLLHVNDSHSDIENASRMSHMIKSAKKHSPKAIVLHAGDAQRGTPFHEVSEKGIGDARIMKEMGVDIYVPGNHDFDVGYTKYGRFAQVNPKMQHICCNWEVKGPLADVIKPYTIKKVDGKKVAFIGLSIDLADYGNASAQIKYIDPAKALHKTICEVQKAEEPDAFIVVSHMGYYRDKEIAGAFPQVNAWVGGHTHTSIYYPKKIVHPGGTKSYVVQADDSYRYLGLLGLGIKDHQVVESKGSLIKVTPTMKQDPRVKTIIKDYAEDLKKYDKVIAHSKNIISGQSRTTIDSRLGNLVTDIMRDHLPSKFGKADIALFNYTGLRESIPRGDVTLGNIFKMSPFGNRIMTVDLTGEQIQQMLDNSARRGGDPISGLIYGIKDKKAVNIIVGGKYSGAPENPYEIIGGEPLDPQKTYKVVSNSYLIERLGSGYDVFDGVKNKVDTKIKVRDMLINVFKKQGEIEVPKKTEVRTRYHVSDLDTILEDQLGTKVESSIPIKNGT